jgi:hypothetical protein
MNSITAALGGALISGVAVYSLAVRTTPVEAFTPLELEAIQQSADAPRVQMAGFRQADPVAVPRAQARRPASSPARVEREAARATSRESERSWSKSALIIGGSAASGAGVGAMVDGKKGAMIGAAIGGGAASIYEATRRR